MKPWLLQCFPLARGTRSWPRDGVPSGQLRPQPGLWFSERQLQAPSIHPPSMGQPGRSGWCGKGRGRCSHQKRVLGTEPQRPRRHAWGRGHTGPEMRPLVTGPLAGCDCRSVRATGSVWSGSGGAPALCVCRADPGLRAGGFVADMRAANYSGSGSLSLSVCELRFDYFFITKLNVFSYLSRYIKSL